MSVTSPGVAPSFIAPVTSSYI